MIEFFVGITLDIFKSVSIKLEFDWVLPYIQKTMQSVTRFYKVSEIFTYLFYINYYIGLCGMIKY